MQVHQVGDRWGIARNFRLIDTNGIGGGRSRSINRVMEVCDFWDGKRWGTQKSMAMTFETSEEAQRYLDDNRGTLEEAPSL